jgi:hypothetical protein
VTDDQIKARLVKMPAPQLRELARNLGFTERTMYLWAKTPPKRKLVREALEKALQSSGRGK